MSIDNPFNFNDWGNHHDLGGTSTGSDVELGNVNVADPLDATTVQVFASQNAALFGVCSPPAGDPGEPGVGVFGRGQNPRGIGVGGASDKGTGVYGMSTESGGIGVVGRSMAGDEAETAPITAFVGTSAGVLGHANIGVGVLGHGGSLLPPEASPPPDPDPNVRGAVFSSGWRSLQNLEAAQDPQLVSLSSRPQIQLVPSTSPVLPSQARLGDFYFVMAVHEQGILPILGTIGGLWICTQIVGTQPMWQRVQMAGPALAGGSPVPQG